MSKRKKMKTIDLPIQFLNERASVAYKTDGSAGMDVVTTIEEPVTLGTLDRYKFPTGIVCAVPIGYELQVRPRSGLAINDGLTIINTPGTIDSDYRGEIGVCVINLSKEPVTINPNDRIAQLVLKKVKKAKLVETNIIGNTEFDTERGDGGFGHTGVNNSEV